MPTRYQTRGVLAGAYKGKSTKALLTHLIDTKVFGDADGTALCGRADNLADRYSMTDQQLAERPTCPVCALKWDRYVASPEKA